MYIIKAEQTFTHNTDTGSFFKIKAFSVYSDPDVEGLESLVLNLPEVRSKAPVSDFCAMLVEHLPENLSGRVHLYVFGEDRARLRVSVPDVFVEAQMKLLESDKAGLHHVDRKGYEKSLAKLKSNA